MPRQVWKFEVERDTRMPIGAEILCVAEQGDRLYLWALVDPDAETEARAFVAYGTGHHISNPERLRFVGTALLCAGNLVLHVFEEAPHE